ncbi:MAG: GNAT family N-acetyltransferase [Dethiobacter sp.]|nr:GNAT family N-acetyltransferase [Dethiobacter sp.]
MSSEFFIGSHQCDCSTWDTNYFGIKCGRIVLNGTLNSNDLRDIAEWVQAVDFVTIYNIANDPLNNLMLCQSQLRPFLADVNIKFCRFLAKLDADQQFSRFFISIESMSELDEGIVSVATTCFTHSRFYNDPNIPVEKARGVYAHWVSTAFNRSDRFFVKAKINGMTMGFILFTLNKSESTCVVELIGVNPQASGLGIGSTLLNQLALHTRGIGITKIKVGTQANNTKAVRFYEQNGFSYDGCTSVFHVWAKNIMDPYCHHQRC